jgi:hypothetical protein
MEIIEFKKNNLLVRVNQDEALRLIASLAQQIIHNDSNTYREEFYPIKNAEYFSIAVTPKKGKWMEEKHGKANPKVVVDGSLCGGEGQS